MTTTIATQLPMPFVEGVDHSFVQLADGRMHVATMGSGEPVVLLSGFAQTWWEWRSLMPALAAAGYRAIAPDLRGEGWSDLPFKPIARTKRAEDVLALLEKIGLDRVRLVSHDMGAITAFQLALQSPNRVLAHVMLSVPPPQMRFSREMLPGMRHLWHQEVLSIPGVGTALLRSGRLPRRLYSHFSAQRIAPEDVEVYIALLRDPELSEAAGPLCRRMVLPELFRIIRGAYRHERFAMPTLFCFGTDDVGFPAHVTRGVFATPDEYGDDVRFALVDDAGHYVVDEAPEAVARLVVDFFAAA
jgi:pimeloyl-ACP methyl ester carboxylesterase